MATVPNSRCEVNTSVYVFDAAVLEQAIANLNADNAQGEFYLTDALTVARQVSKVGAFAAPDPLSVEGVNDRVQLASLAKAHNLRVCRQWMLDGVTIVDPQTTWIEDEVEMESDAVILPGCFLQDTPQSPMTLWSAPTPRSSMRRSSRGPCGAFPRAGEPHRPGSEHWIWTYLRPGNEIGTGSKAGAFVEMKKAHIGDGSKVPHLSYVGDADLGENTNIGGGTITANYDGVHKNHTHIGSDVHIGAGNLFVAPVNVGTVSPAVRDRSSDMMSRATRWCTPRTRNML